MIKALRTWRLLCLAVVIAAGRAGAGVELYVAPNGNDGNAGTKAKPFASLERARAAVRDLAQKQGLPKGGATVWLRGGDYPQTNAFELAAADSGTASAPVCWRAYPDETVRLLGGRRLAGFSPVTNSAVLRRLNEEARAQVRQLDLRALGIPDFGEMKSRGFARALTPSHCELFFEGRPKTLARWPNEGSFEQIAGTPAAGTHKDEHGGQLGKLEDGFYFSGDRPGKWKETNDLWVHGYWAWDWANSYERVASLDREQRLIKTASPYGLYGFRKGQRFYFLNVLEELDQAGEWFLDRAAGVLYFWPPAPLNEPNAKERPLTPALSPSSLRSAATEDGSEGERENRRQSLSNRSTEILVSLLDQPLLKLTGASNITVRGLVLEATRGNAVEIRGGTSNLIAGCVIRNIGNSGVSIQGGAGHGVRSCDVFDTGDGGVSLDGGDRKTLTPGGHFVENCHFARQGRWSRCYVPAVLMNGVGQRASNNLIQDHPHCAILFGGNDHLIEFNEIHHIALETGDVGAIYAGRDYTCRGNRIRHNFIHHTGGVGMGSMGVYMDDCVSGTEIAGNIFYKVQRAVFLGGGRDHQVISNVFVECNYAVELDGRGLDNSPVWRGMVDDTMRKRLAEVPPDLYRERYPALKALDRYYGPPGGPAIEGESFKGVPPEDNVVARNACAGKWLRVGWHATPAMLRLENNLTNAEPSFVSFPADDARPKDFALRSGSPASQLGLKSIPADKIGLHQDELRAALP